MIYYILQINVYAYVADDSMITEDKKTFIGFSFLSFVRIFSTLLSLRNSLINVYIRVIQSSYYFKY
jgi:hypothetical protein